MTTSDCEHAESSACPEVYVLDRYHAGSLTEPQACRVREHVERCTQCKGVLNDIESGTRIGELLHEARRDLPPEVRARLVDSATTIIHEHSQGRDSA